VNVVSSVQSASARAGVRVWLPWVVTIGLVALTVALWVLLLATAW
jgi:hypothetical protein